MSKIIELYTMAEAAAKIGVTKEDSADPARWVRDQVRRHKLQVVRIGNTPKLSLNTIETLIELQTCRYDCGEEKIADLETGTSWDQLLSGETVVSAQSKSSRQVLERLTKVKPKRSSTKSKPDTVAKTLKTGMRPNLSVVS